MPVYLAPHPLRPKGLLTRVLPFGLPATAGVIIAVATTTAWPHPWMAVAACALTALLALAVLFAPWLRVPRALAALPPLCYILIVVLLREGAGISPPGLAPLLVLPLLWLALYGTRTELLVGFGLMAASSIGASVRLAPTPEQLRFQLLGLVTAPIVCLTVQQLVLRVRTQAWMLKELARTDVLTGLANRRAWDERLAVELERARRDKRAVSVAILDLDHFKRLNDERGHHAGDLVLIESSRAWKGLLRKADLIARHGGEEFAVLLPTCDGANASLVIERLRKATPVGQTCSAGVATWDGRESAEALMGRADAAMYQAKRGGRDRTISSVTPLHADEPEPGLLTPPVLSAL